MSNGNDHDHDHSHHSHGHDDNGAASGTRAAARVRDRHRLVRVRKNILHLSDQELADLRRAFEGLYAISEEVQADERGYQWIAGVHGYPPPIYCQHGNLNFPPWHRAYLYELELRLQEQVPSVMLPYWEWDGTVAAAEGLPEAVTADTWVDPESGEERPNPLKSAFSQVTGERTRRFPGQPVELEELAELVEIALAEPDYSDFSLALENPHNGLHVWVGGDMGQVPLAAYDPIFWLHHANVDRQFWEWQQEYGNDSVPPGVRAFVCAPFPYTGEETLDTRWLGYTYAESESYVTPSDEVDMAEEMGGLEMPLPPTAVFDLGTIPPGFEHAWLEFHGLHKTEESYVVRVFCASRRADVYSAATERRGNPAYARSLYLFGHGECIGAQGHCDPGRVSPRPAFDHRPPDHLAPYDTWLDVTEAVRQAIGDGETSLRLELVVVDTDGEQVPSSVVELDGLALVTSKQR